MATPSCARSSFGLMKRVKVAPQRVTPFRRAASNGATHAAVKRMGLDPAEFERVKKEANRNMAKETKKLRDRDPQELQRRWKEAQNAPDSNSLLQLWKTAGIEPIELAKKRGLELPNKKETQLDPETAQKLHSLRIPRNVEAVNLRPLRRAPSHGLPVCDLQLRTYSVRNIEFFADFAMRAAYYLSLPARGPIPLPRITERWTVPRANFIFKKSQENFERITIRRLIQIQDGHPDVVKVWLAFLQKHAYYGIGMKANVWEFEGLDVGKNMDAAFEGDGMEGRMNQKTLKKVEELLGSEGFRKAMQEKSGGLRAL